MKKRTIYFAAGGLVLLSMIFCAFTFLPEVLPGDRLKIRVSLTVDGKTMKSQTFFQSQCPGQKAEKKFASCMNDGTYHLQLPGKEKGEYIVKFKCDSNIYQRAFQKVPELGIYYIKGNDWSITTVDCHINLKKEDGRWIASYDVEYSEAGRGSKETYIVRDNKVLRNGDSSLVYFGL